MDDRKCLIDTLGVFAVIHLMSLVLKSDLYSMKSSYIRLFAYLTDIFIFSAAWTVAVSYASVKTSLES